MTPKVKPLGDKPQRRVNVGSGSKSYYERFGSRFREYIESVNESRSGSGDLFWDQQFALFELAESGITKHRLRYYQTEALYVLDHLLELPPDRPERKLLTEVIDKEGNVEAPFLGFEMATGSGKTMLMGASIFYLFKKYGIRNYLIITPASTDIYHKTILNFARGTFESVWANDAPFSYNLITGDDYTARPLYDGFDSTRDFSIFVFNISKFGTNAINTTKPWEASIWKDQNGNTVSIRDYLHKEELVILTDEAHHAQNRVSKEIIKSFHPKCVLEYTATAVESSKSEAKKSQTIVYKYDIRRLLEDGYGKTIKAVALNVDELEKRANKAAEVPRNEKLKLITLVLIHLLKKHAVVRDEKMRGLKPIAFVKVKNETSFAQKVFDYLRSELHQDIENLEIILEKLDAQELEITDLLHQLFQETFAGDLRRLRREIERVTQTAIFYHGKSDKDTEKKWNNVKRNEVQVVVYMQRLDEGIDLPNIYSMAVVADNHTELLTSVKQIIGRGVRLGKEKREFDESTDLVLAQAEKLHVVCDQGAAFEEVILSIQKEFGLTDRYLSIERERKKIINRVQSNRLEGLFLPEIRADLKARPGVMLMDLVRDIDKIAEEYVKHNCFQKEPGDDDDGTIPAGIFLKFNPGAFFVEVDLFADERVFHQQLKGKFPGEVLVLDDSHARSIYAIVMKQLFCLPDNRESKEIFKRYVEKLGRLGLHFYCSDDADRKLAQSRFITTFASFYRSYIERHYFDLDFKPIVLDDAQPLSQRFTDVEILIPRDQVNDKSWTRIADSKIRNFIEQGYQFFGYDESIYDYVKFDSFPEKQLADYLNSVLLSPNSSKNRFWVRNDRQVYFYYGSRRYYPDFLMFVNGTIYALEIKGEIYSDTKKNSLLSRLSTIDGYRGVLIYSDFMNRVTRDTAWEDFLKGANLDTEMRHGRERLVQDVADEEKFVRFLPAYEPDAAYRKFVRNQAMTRIYGWLEVPANPAGYSDNYFVVQMKGSAMTPDLPHNSWGIFKAKATPREAVGKIVICHHHSITDGNFGNKRVTIRRFNFEKTTADGALFDKIVVTLSPNAADLPVCALKDISSDAGIEIAGVMIDSV